MATTKDTATRIRPMPLSTPTDADRAWAAKLVAEYVATRTTSNRARVARMAEILACYAVAERGEYCALPAVAGDSPVYNRAWRPVRSALSDDQWSAIKVCAVDAGKFTTTSKSGTAYIVPADTITKGDAPAGW